PEQLITTGIKPLLITAKGHGTRQQCRTNKFGFPVRYCCRTKFHKGFQTGDIVKAVVTSKEEGWDLHWSSSYSCHWLFQHLNNRWASSRN
ncbi:MAG: hypothetical protein ACRC8Y_16625, partial [Chroococcales cyanobacterium]